MIHLDTRVCLARHARLRDDPRTGKPILLAPERGLELNPTGARIARLCGEERPVADIVERLVGESDGSAGRAQIEVEVLAFLRALEERGLLVARQTPS
ncbi:MAG TPA: pyrroloquinoline quinone biosynthesis peptide chaperone PqqD [Polyangia bacterium]|nr:pyrroloquinoline quinone biosynthesis peptide chaperone PqqD [Polyangia bacterium]